tara:strand:- start:13 stop:255 length:243 start_codon:yes stop_codon:yes gene_type:complete
MFENRRYLIIPVSEVDKVEWSEIIGSSITVKSLDETKGLIKWDGESPDFISSITGAEGPYTNPEILPILSGTDWVEEEEE